MERGKLNFEEMERYFFKLHEVAKETGEFVLAQRGGKIMDTHDYKGHESSTIDSLAREYLQICLERHLPEFEGVIRFELRPFVKTLLELEKHKRLALIIDEIDGTTNTKRCLASSFEYRPLAAVSIALTLTGGLNDLVIGVVYTLDQGEIFGSMKMSDNRFSAFRNYRLINPDDVILTRGDSRIRILVIGYSNSHRIEKGELEQSLYRQGFRTYEGCRSSGMDIINILRNSADAYVDLRHYWSTKDEEGREKEAMLQVYDVAGVIPIAHGCGLMITDAEGKSWRDYGLDDTIPLVVARPHIHKHILDVIQPLVKKWKKRNKSNQSYQKSISGEK